MATRIQIPIPDNVTLNLTANCHAAWQQTLVYETAESSTTFSGSGEGVAMTTSDGQSLAIVHDRRSGGVLFLSFSASGNANPRVQTPVKHVQGTLVQYTVTSEDDRDDDNNDTYAIFWWNEGQPSR